MLIENKNTNKLETYKILAEFPFDSTRKRMSLIVQSEDVIYLMSKGADSIILPRINLKSKAEE